MERQAVYLHTYGDLDEAMKTFQAAMSWGELSEDSQLRALLHLGMARLLMEFDQWSDAEQFSRKAWTLCVLRSADDLAEQETARCLTDSSHHSSSLLASILLTQGDIYRRMDTLEKAEECYRNAVAILEHLGSHELWAARTNLLALNMRGTHGVRPSIT